MRLSEADRPALFEEIFVEARAAFFRVWVEKDASIAYPNVAVYDPQHFYNNILKRSIKKAKSDWMHPSSKWAQRLQSMMPSKRDSLTDGERQALVAQLMPHFIDAFDAELVRVRDDEFAPELSLYEKHPAIIEIVGNRELDIEMKRDNGIALNDPQASKVSRERADSIMSLLDGILPSATNAKIDAERQKRETIEGFKSLIKDDAPLHKRVFKKLFKESRT